MLKEAIDQYGLRLLVLIAIAAAFVATTPNFGGESATFAVLDRFSIVGILALGVAVTMIAGELDLSASSVAAFSAIVAVHLSGHGLAVAIIGAVLCGLAFGLVQGAMIARMQINSMVFTIGSLILIRGLCFVISDEKPVVVKDLADTDPLLERWGVLSPPILIAFAMFLLLGGFLAYTSGGREIYAVGGARKEARTAGVPVNKALVTSFAISGMCAGLAGSMAALRGGSASPDGLNDLLLAGVAAALLGGIGLHGGRGTAISVALGVAIVAVANAGLAAAGAQAYVMEFTTGALLVGVIGIELVLRTYKGRRGKRAALAYRPLELPIEGKG